MKNIYVEQIFGSKSKPPEYKFSQKQISGSGEKLKMSLGSDENIKG